MSVSRRKGLRSPRPCVGSAAGSLVAHLKFTRASVWQPSAVLLPCSLSTAIPRPSPLSLCGRSGAGEPSGGRSGCRPMRRCGRRRVLRCGKGGGLPFKVDFCFASSQDSRKRSAPACSFFSRRNRGRPALWVLTLLICSYLLLIPALFAARSIRHVYISLYKYFYLLSQRLMSLPDRRGDSLQYDDWGGGCRGPRGGL